MSDYKSEYEEYYKNINKNNGNEKRKQSFLKNKDYRNKSLYDNYDDKIKFFSMDYWSRRIIRELCCALALIVFFLGIKYIKITQMTNLYDTCKYTISHDFDYDGTIDYLDTIEVGNFKAKDLKIGGVTVEDLKYEKIKTSIVNYIENIKAHGGD